MKLKLEEEYFKTLIYVSFLLLLLVSILFSVSSRFLWIQIVEVYNKVKQIEYSLRQW